MDLNQQNSASTRYTLGGDSDKRPHPGPLNLQSRKMVKTTATSNNDNNTMNKRHTLPAHAIPPYSQQQTSQNQWSSQSSGKRLTANQRYPNKTLTSKALDIFNSGGVFPQTSQKKPKTVLDVRNHDVMKQNVRTIIDYLVSHQYGNITPRELRGMSAKVFESIFKFMYLVYDPDYTFHPKFKDEFFRLARELKYPYIDSINPKSLDSIAAPHSLPRYLALLAYMAELCQDIERLSARSQVGDQGSTIDASKGMTPRQMDGLFWDYGVAKYHAFMQGNDGSDVDEELEQVFGAIRKGNMEHHNSLVNELHIVEQETRQIEQRMASYKQKQQEKRDLDEKSKNVMATIDTYKRKLAKSKNIVEESDRELETLNKMLLGCVTSRDEHRAKMKYPDISDEEFQRTMELQTKLDMTVENQRITLDELQQEQWMKEMEKEKKRCEIARTTLEYNNLIKTMANVTVDHHPILNELLVFDPANTTDMITPRLDEKDQNALESKVRQVKASVTELEQLEAQQNTDYRRIQQKNRQDRQELAYLEEDYQKKTEQLKALQHDSAVEARHFNETKEQLTGAGDKVRRDAVVERIHAQAVHHNAQLRLDSTLTHIDKQKKAFEQKLSNIESNLEETDNSMSDQMDEATAEFAKLFPPVPLKHH